MKTVRDVSVDEINTSASDTEPLLLDVREEAEVASGRIATAVHIPRAQLAEKIAALVPDQQTPIVTYCAGGKRARLAAETLMQLGYMNVASLTGGITAWLNAGYPIDHGASELTDVERRRYSRHLSIPEVGEAGQLKLRDAKVLIVGAGGLGSPAAYYLAAAGVGTIGIIDSDQVDESNLQRQILHTTDRIGTAKVHSAAQTLHAINPLVTIQAINQRLTSKNVTELFTPYDLIIDGSDNFATRYLINDACILLKKPFIHGSVLRFGGNVAFFEPQQGPCYRCLYPEPPPADVAPTCAEAGVLGVVPGVIGLLQATEALKWLLKTGDLLNGRLLHYNALNAEFRSLLLIKDPDCTHCGANKTFSGYIDYDSFCASANA